MTHDSSLTAGSSPVLPPTSNGLFSRLVPRPVVDRLARLQGLWQVLGIGLLLLPIAAHKLHWLDFTPAHAPAEADHASEATAAEVRDTVQLTAEKLQAAGIETGTASQADIRQTRLVPGYIEYDQSSHVSVSLPSESIVVKVIARPGQQVRPGEALAICSSTAIGLARDKIASCQVEVGLAEREARLAKEVEENVTSLLDLLQTTPTFADMEKSATGKTLQEYREQLFSAYSRYLLAQQALTNLTSVLQDGAVSQRMFEEKRSQQEQAAAQFQSACEIARLAVAKDNTRAQAAYDHAIRARDIASHDLSALLGQNTITDSSDHMTNSSEFVLAAPRDGVVVERAVAAAQRVSAGQTMFALANTQRMWVRAEIHEREWKSLEYAEGQTLEIQAPALDNARFSAPFRYVGAAVNPDSRSLPLFAEIDNTAGKFRPGMFVWVEIPLSKPRQATVVPAGAVMRHEERPFVFLALGDSKFQRRDVELGWETRDAVEIRHGLNPGDAVATHGAFYLKSELLLEREEE